MKIKRTAMGYKPARGFATVHCNDFGYESIVASILDVSEFPTHSPVLDAHGNPYEYEAAPPFGFDLRAAK